MRNEPKRIGVWQTAFLGDAVLTLPFLAALRQRFPQARIEFFVRAGLEDLFAAQPGIDAVHGFAKRGRERGFLAALAMGRKLAGQGFDLWISAHRSLRSAVVAKSSGIPRRIGYDRPWFNRLAYTATVDRSFDRLEEVERIFQLGGPLGVVPPAPKAGLVLPEAALERARRVFEEELPEGDGPVLGLHPGSTWPTKCWPVNHFSEIVNRASQAGVRVALFAGPGEEGVAAAVLHGAIRSAKPFVLDLSGRLSLPELAACIGRVDAYLTNDSGPMHLAWVQDVPLVALFGPTVRELGFFPRGEGSTVLECVLPCRPCGLHGHKRCPEGHHRCMRDLSPDQVWRALAPKLGLTIPAAGSGQARP